MRIASLLPSATEILFAIGLGDSVVGVTHECDFPPEATKKPVLIHPRVKLDVPAAEIDRQVSELVAQGGSIYSVDAELLRKLSPDLIVTQDLCHVCAASPDDLATALKAFPKPPRVLSLTPRSLAEVWDDVRRVGEVTESGHEAGSLAHAIERKVAAIEATADFAAARPRVVCLEWLDPLYVGGHWIPEMVAKAGGVDVLGRAHEPSFRVTPEDVEKACPDIIVIMLCGYGTARVAEEFRAAELPEVWKRLPAVRERRVFAVDASSYFSRPGPRLADGVAILAQLIHPTIFRGGVPADTFVRL